MKTDFKSNKGKFDSNIFYVLKVFANLQRYFFKCRGVCPKWIRYFVNMRSHAAGKKKNVDLLMKTSSFSYIKYRFNSWPKCKNYIN